MSASSSHSPLHKPEQDSAWVPPLGMALDLARDVLAERATANIHDPQAMIAAAVDLEIRLRGLVAALDKGNELAAAVAAHGPFPMPVGEPMPVELTEEQLEALIDAGNGALSDYYHERQCHCSDYPAGCVTNSGYRRAAGHWDTDAFAIGLPAVLGVWESLRNDRHAAKIAELRARVAELETAPASPWERAVAGLNALVDAGVAFHVEPDGHISAPFSDEHIEWDRRAERWVLTHDDEDEGLPPLPGELAEQRHLVDPLDHVLEHLADEPQTEVINLDAQIGGLLAAFHKTTGGAA